MFHHNFSCLTFSDIWDLKNLQYDWPTESEAPIFRHVSADEYATHIEQTPVKYGVFVQCINDSIDEARMMFLLFFVRLLNFGV